MTSPDRYRWLSAAAAVLWLSGCSHTPGAADIPPGATFTTKILADDTKLFVYSQGSSRYGRSGNEGDAGGDARGHRHGDEGSGDDFSSSQGAQMLKTAQRGVQAMLAQNHYCRDGYLVLEQYQEHRNYIIRGECRDAANAAERSKF